MIGLGSDKVVTFGSDGDHHSAPRLRLLNLADHFLVDSIADSNGDHWHLVINQRDWAVFHLTGWIPLGVNVADFLELERSLQRNWVVDAAPQVQEILVMGQLFRQSFDFTGVF